MADVDGAIRVEIDPGAMLPERYLGSDEDGPRYGAVTLYDAIIDAAARKLVGVGEKVLREVVEAQVLDRVVGEIDARLPGIIEAAFAEPVEVGDGFSSRTRTMRELIGDRVKEQCRPSSGHYSADTKLDKVVREEVDRALYKEFSEEVQRARKAVKDAVTAKAAELLAAESLREVGIR